MIYLVVKTAISAIIIVVVSEVARRSAGLGALLASLPLVAVLSMIWLWRDTGDCRAPRGSNGRDGLFGCSLIPINHQDFRTFVGEPDGASAANSRCSGGDDSAFVDESHECPP